MIATFPIRSLQNWVGEAEVSLQNAETMITNHELDLEGLRALISAYSSCRGLFKVVESLFERHSRILSNARTECDDYIRGLGIKSLPVELMRVVFQLVCTPDIPQGASPFAPKRKHRSDPRFKLAHVSRSWRRIILGMPQLWSTSSITYNTSPGFVEFILQHTESLPLHIRLNSRSGRTTPAEAVKAVEEKLMRLCLSLVDRCQIITMEFSNVQECISLLGMLARPSLQEVRLERWAGGSQYQDNWILIPFIAAPNLSAFISYNPIMFDSVVADQLTIIRLECSIHDLLQPLISCRNLRDASLQLAPPERGSMPPLALPPRELVTAPTLVKLHLGFEKDGRWWGLFHIMQYLRAPSLETFSFALPFDFGREPSREITTELKRIQNSLGLASATTINSRLPNSFGSEDYRILFALLAIFPNVRHLECLEVQIGDIYRGLRDAEAKQFLSHLQSLTLIQAFHPLLLGSSGDAVVEHAVAAINRILSSAGRTTDFDILLGPPLAEYAQVIHKQVEKDITTGPWQLRILPSSIVGGFGFRNPVKDSGVSDGHRGGIMLLDDEDSDSET